MNTIAEVCCQNYTILPVSVFQSVMNFAVQRKTLHVESLVPSYNNNKNDEDDKKMKENKQINK